MTPERGRLADRSCRIALSEFYLYFQSVDLEAVVEGTRAALSVLVFFEKATNSNVVIISKNK